MRTRLFVQVTALVSVAVLAAACSGGSSSSRPSSPSSPTGPAPVTSAFPGAATPSGSWPYPNGDIGNTRVAPDSVISAANVSGLREAWTFKLAGQAAAGLTGVGSLTAPPVVQDGVVYLQDEDANVYALALATGKLKWEYQVNVPEKSGPGPDGVAVAGGAVYGDTSTTVFKVPSLPLGAATVSQDLVFTTLYTGELLALNRNTGAIVYRQQLPTSTNAPISVFGNTVLVPAGGPKTSSSGGGGSPQLVAYTVP